VTAQDLAVTAATDRGTGRPEEVAVRLDQVRRTFGAKLALDGVSLSVRRGEIHALLGPNGAGKTTLIRVLTGLTTPDGGEIEVFGRHDQGPSSRQLRGSIGFVPSGDRSFYLRISGLENLRFFARLHGMSRKQALERSWQCLRSVDLEEAAKRAVGVYSHGMQKRLSFARAILTDPPLLLVDEATHDLDPEASIRIQQLAADAAEHGAAILWATQRLDEVRSFAHRVTLLHEGHTRFQGSVPDLLAMTETRRFLLQLDRDEVASGSVFERAAAVLGDDGVLVRGDDDTGHAVLHLADGVVLGRGIAALVGAGISILACREERSAMEAAFLHLTQRQTP